MGKNRKIAIYVLIVLTAFIFTIQLSSLQFTENDYKQASETQDMRISIPPYRGLIEDRNGKLLVYNEPHFDLAIILNNLDLKGDTTDFCKTVGVSKKTLLKTLDEARKNKFKPFTLRKNLTSKEYAQIQDYLSKYTGIEVIPRTVRRYPFPHASNILGYMREISDVQLKKDSIHKYKQGDLIGIKGIEESYEHTLRGKPGVRYILTNKFGVEKSPFKEGQYDTLALPGTNIQSTIDIELQAFGEKLMTNKIGSIVAIEPKTGEILALVTAPNYDPNALTSGNKFSKNYSKLNQDTLKPLINRPLMSKYSPGSIFKLVQALIAMEEGVATSRTFYFCNKNLIGCHNHQTPLDLPGAIQHSCNPYFYNIFRSLIHQKKLPDRYEDAELGFNNWRKHVVSFGFGDRLGVDIPNENKGFIPKDEYYDRYYGDKRWKFSTIYSLSIGQGEIQVTPLQMANLAVVIANKGYFVTPHLVRGEREFEKHTTTVSSEHYPLVIDAMEKVVTSGTARRTFIKDIPVCGKTGTVENAHGEDHSVFIAFAPKDDPKIAVAVFVENGGFGGTWAAPIASLMIEKYLKGEITRDYLLEYVMQGDFIHKNEDEQ